MRINTYRLPLPDDVASYTQRVCELPSVRAWTQQALAEKDFIDFEEPFRLKA